MIVESIKNIYKSILSIMLLRGYACWTAMVLDFLPYKAPFEPRKKLGWIRYVTFSVSLAFVGLLFLLNARNIERIMFWAFLIGNLLS